MNTLPNSSSYPHAIITGGSSGIGKAMAQQLARQGYHISIIARRQSHLEAAQAEIAAACCDSAQKVQSFSADVTNREQIEGAIATAISQLGPPDLLVTCAGIAQPGHFQDIPIDIFETTMAVNYFGTLYSIRAVCQSMVERRRGTILVVSSTAGLIGVYGYSPYCPSKFAVRGLAETLRAELKPSGVQVSIAYPPDTDTPQLAAEAKTKPLATQRISAMAKPWSADAVAQAIIRGIQRRDFMITPGFDTTLVGKMHSLLAPLSNCYFDSIVAKTLAETQQPKQ